MIGRGRLTTDVSTHAKLVLTSATIGRRRHKLTGAIVRVADAAANGTFEKVLVIVAVVLVT